MKKHKAAEEHLHKAKAVVADLEDVIEEKYDEEWLEGLREEERDFKKRVFDIKDDVLARALKQPNNKHTPNERA